MRKERNKKSWFLSFRGTKQLYWGLKKRLKRKKNKDRESLSWVSTTTFPNRGSRVRILAGTMIISQIFREWDESIPGRCFIFSQLISHRGEQHVNGNSLSKLAVLAKQLQIMFLLMVTWEQIWALFWNCWMKVIFTVVTRSFFSFLLQEFR